MEIKSETNKTKAETQSIEKYYMDKYDENFVEENIVIIHIFMSLFNFIMYFLGNFETK